MSRAVLRRSDKEQEKKVKTFVMTQEQIDDIKRQAAKEVIDKISQDSFILMLAIPLEVLITEEYWMSTAKEDMPKFIDEVLRVYKGYADGMISLDEMKEDLWTFAGVRVDEK